MGRKEQEKKAKRAAEGLEGATPAKVVVVKRLAGPPAASRTASTASTEQPSENNDVTMSPDSLGELTVQVEKVFTVQVPDTEGQLEAEAAQPCASLGMVEAEGVGGKYTCAECRAKFLRSEFLIEATDLEGIQNEARDWQGMLQGRCYECVRGRGPAQAPDMFADSGMEEARILKIFKRQVGRRHNQRTDVKKNEAKLLKITRFQELMEAIEKKFPNMTKEKRRQEVMYFCRTAAQACVESMSPELLEDFKKIAERYKRGKDLQAMGDDAGIPCPHPAALGENVQYLHKIMPSLSRFFICRQQHCTPNGSFFGLNTDWMTTAPQGWKFVCPACGTPYRPNLTKASGLIPANHLWVLEKTGQAILAEWPDSQAERYCTEGAQMMAEHAAGMKFEDLSREEILLRMGNIVASTGVKYDDFKKRPLRPQVIATVEKLNANRGAKKHPYTWDHIKDGFTGSFYRYVEGVSPIMKSSDVNDYLALLYCLLNNKE